MASKTARKLVDEAIASYDEQPDWFKTKIARDGLPFTVHVPAAKVAACQALAPAGIKFAARPAAERHRYRCGGNLSSVSGYGRWW